MENPGTDDMMISNMCKEIGCEDMNCTYLEQYRNQWWDLVHRIVILGIPQKCTLTR